MADVKQASNSSPEVDTTWDDAKSAFDEVTQGPATEPELPLSEEPATETTTETKPEVETKTDDRPRDEQGRFIEKDKSEAKPVAAKPQEAAPQEPPKSPSAPPAAAKVEATAAPPVGPPPGWSIKSKSEWDKLPEHIRADMVKRETEVSQGFAQYSGMKELQPYVEMARQGGTTLKAALDNYVGIERLLRQDPFRAITQIANNIGIRPEQLVTGLSLHLGVQSNGHAQPQEGQPTGLPPEVLQQYFNPLHQEVSQLKQLLSNQQQEAEARAASALNSTLSRFQADPSHRYYENVRAKMAQLIKAEVVPATGDDMADLKAAYELACWQDPEIRSLLINEQSAKTAAQTKQKEKDAADKARQASKSITGSPSSTVTENRNRSGDSIEDDARDAYRSVMASSRV